MKIKSSFVFLPFLMIALVSAAWWNPMGWGRGQDMPMYYNDYSNKDVDWPMVSWGNMGYGQGMMGGLYDYDFVNEYPKEELSEAEKEALVIAIKEEYKARAMYRKSVEQFGESMPFSHISWAENSHINLLKKLMDKYGENIPEDEYMGSYEDYGDFYDACEKASRAEIDNIGIYAKLFEDVDNLDINEVFSLLQWGSSMHLRAFQMCSYGGMGMTRGYSEGNYGRGLGMGMMRGRY